MRLHLAFPTTPFTEEEGSKQVLHRVHRGGWRDEGFRLQEFTMRPKGRGKDE